MIIICFVRFGEDIFDKLLWNVDWESIPRAISQVKRMRINISSKFQDNEFGRSQIRFLKNRCKKNYLTESNIFLSFNLEKNGIWMETMLWLENNQSGTFEGIRLRIKFQVLIKVWLQFEMTKFLNPELEISNHSKWRNTKPKDPE